MGNYLTFTKDAAGSAVEVHMHTRVFSGNFGGAVPFGPGPGGVKFEVRIDDAASSIGNVATITSSGSIQFVSIFAVFQSLPAGTHTVSVWVSTNVGISIGALLDTGGWGGRIVVKETF